MGPFSSISQVNIFSLERSYNSNGGCDELHSKLENVWHHEATFRAIAVDKIVFKTSDFAENILPVAPRGRSLRSAWSGKHAIEGDQRFSRNPRRASQPRQGDRGDSQEHWQRFFYFFNLCSRPMGKPDFQISANRNPLFFSIFDHPLDNPVFT